MKMCISGQSFVIPFTVYGVPSSIFIILPIGSSLPKYFLANFSVNTITCGSLRAVLGLPFKKGIVKMSKIVESAQKNLVSLNTLSL